MKLNYLLIIITVLNLTSQTEATYTNANHFPYAPAAGKLGSTAIGMTDASIVAWATSYQQVTYGVAVDAVWQTPHLALGPAVGSPFDTVSLGRGGAITLTFARSIVNGSGIDFCIFENGFAANFLELAWVEVSTDGVHFVRFPNYSFSENPVGGFGTIEPTFIFGYAGKYQQGYGTPFDLQQLQSAYAAALLNPEEFSSQFQADLVAHFPLLDLNDIRYVRIVDIIGDGSARDADGYAIYDPYPTTGSAGFDLEAVGVIHQRPTAASQTFAQFAAAQGLTGVASDDWDADGDSDMQEFIMGTHAKDPRDFTRLLLEPSKRSDGASVVRMEYTARHNVVGAMISIEQSTDGVQWSEVHPRIVDVRYTTVEGVDLAVHRVELPWNAAFEMYRLQLSSSTGL